MRRLDLGLFLALVLCAIAVVHTSHRERRLNIDIESERGIAEQLAADERRLLADQASLSAAIRVERAAVALRMHQPEPNRTVAVSQLPAMAAAQSPTPAAGQGSAVHVAALAQARLAHFSGNPARQ